MSGGWIKVEKDLETDPRFRRMVRSQCNAHVTPVSISTEYSATLLFGCLTRLWIYADTHIREDDTLDLGTDEIDQLVGVEGFCDLMPTDWLEVINPQCVKLPGFQSHNGTDAKKKALTAKRVARHRIRNVTQGSNEHSTGSNAVELPDQTRQDQTKTRPKECKSAHDAPRETESEDQIFVQVSLLKTLYPKGAAREDWIAAEKHCRQLVEDADATWDSLADGVTRYAKLCKATDRLVLNPANFFGAQDRPWSQAWPMPEKESDKRRQQGIDASWARVKNHAAAIGCPLRPYEHDTPDTFETRVKNWEVSSPRAPGGPTPITKLLGEGMHANARSK